MHEFSTNNTNDGKLVYPELSYIIMGILFEVHNKLGTKYQEKHYQQAIETKLKQAKILYQREVKIKVDFEFEDEKLGDFYLDFIFIIDSKIILETKKVWQITQDDIKPVLRYLDATNLKLEIIANFEHKRLQYRHVLN